MAKIRIVGDSSGYVEIAAPNAAGNNTLELPSSGTRLVGSDSAGNVSVSGIVTATTFSGNLNSTGVSTFTTAYINTLSGISTISADSSVYINQNLVFASGKGIDFSATSQAAGMTSELLADYEEGTFTPTWINSSGSTVSPSSGVVGGAYTKIGRMVHIRIHTYSVSNLTNIRRIQGLPFTIAGTTDYGGGGVVVGQHGASGAQSNLSIPNLTIVRDATPNGIQFNSDYSFPTSGTNIDICFWYQAE